MTRTQEQVLAERDRLAAEIKKQAKAAGNPVPTDAQANAQVWKDHPELKAESRKAQPAPVKEATDDQARINNTYAKIASDMARQDSKYWTMKGYEMRNLIRLTPDGKALVALERDLAKNRRNPEATREIRKSVKHAHAYALIRKWETAAT